MNIYFGKRSTRSHVATAEIRTRDLLITSQAL